MESHDGDAFSQDTAADPATPPAVLSEMARLRPDLRPVIWGNPTCSEGLRSWMRDAQAAEAAEAAGAAVPAFEEPIQHAATVTSPRVPPPPPPPVPAPVQEPVQEPVPVPAPALVQEPVPAPTPVPAPVPATDAAGSVPPPPGPPQPVAPAGPAPTRPAKRRSRRRLITTVAVIALVLGAAGGGFVAGWTASGEIEARKPATENTVVEVEVPRYSTDGSVPMPDVRGLDEAAAREVLADAGIPPEIITVSAREAAGPEDVVVEQVPAFGTTNPVAVDLVVSTTALVPSIEGMDAAALVASLGVLGADVELVSAYVPGAVAGSALLITPATGEVLPTHVTITVAEASSSIYLRALDRVDGQCSANSAQVNGVIYPNALTCSSDVDGKESSWVVSRLVDSFEATVGVPDDGDPAARVRVEVFADGVAVGAVEAGYGAPATLTAPVTGALRLTVRTTLLSAEAGSRSSEDAVLGDARLVGGVTAIAGLAP